MSAMPLTHRRETRAKRPRYHLVATEDGRSIRLHQGKVRLVHRDDPTATVFNARQATRWMKHHPQCGCAAVAIGSEVWA